MTYRRMCCVLLMLTATVFAVSERSSLAATLDAHGLVAGAHPGSDLTETPLQFLSHHHFHYAYIGPNGSFDLHGSTGKAVFSWPIPNPTHAYSLQMKLVRKSNKARVYKLLGKRAWVRLETTPDSNGKYAVQTSLGTTWDPYDKANVFPVKPGHPHGHPHCPCHSCTHCYPHWPCHSCTHCCGSWPCGF
jgi:hypothetical protein